uniref:Uncharacterized protein n=1 Tax=Anguilla anguilla TaxID=7936 RepID=A0A0E9XA76_ANGAN
MQINSIELETDTASHSHCIGQRCNATP